MSSTTDTDSNDDSSDRSTERLRIEHGDTLKAPNGHVYRIVNVYEDAGGATRMKLRQAEARHNMYRTIHQVRALIADKGWQLRERSTYHDSLTV